MLTPEVTYGTVKLASLGNCSIDPKVNNHYVLLIRYHIVWYRNAFGMKSVGRATLIKSYVLLNIPPIFSYRVN